MKISRVTLENVRGFQDLLIDFGDQGASTLITGDNGDGKSTVLRAIALGLCDTLGASGLLAELPGSFIRYGKSKADVEIELIGTDRYIYKINTSVELQGNTEVVKQKYWKRAQSGGDRNKDHKIGAEEFPWLKLFGAGYGAGIRILGTERYQHYYLTDSVYTLFKSDAKLQEQELALRRIFDHGRSKLGRRAVETKITQTLESILNFRGDMKVLLKENGIFFSRTAETNSDFDTELTAMGDGVRAVVTLVLDLMSWWYLNLNERELLSSSASYDTMKIDGIVLIDEIEKHLHPSWQREIVGNLLTKFPKVQFIFSTHAPLCVSGSTDFSLKKIFLYRTARHEDQYLYGYRYSLPQGYTADQVLTSEAFGLETSRSPAVGKLLALIKPLIEKTPRSQSEEKKLKRLFEKLRKISPATVEQQRDLEMEIRLKKLLRTTVKTVEKASKEKKKK